MSTHLNGGVTLEDRADSSDETTAWIRRTIWQRRCCAIVSPKDNVCECGLAISSHGETSSDSSGDMSWNIDKHTIHESTTAFGEVDFLQSSRTSKYVRIDASTPITIIDELLFKRWKLERPQLILNVAGAAVNLKWQREKSERFQRSIASFVERSAGAWVISDGTNSGVSQLVGEAIKNANFVAGAASQKVFLGIASWGALDLEEKEALKNSGGVTLMPQNLGKPLKGNEVAEASLETSDKSEQAIVEDAEEQEKQAKAHLDPYGHTHFLLVDDGSTCKLDNDRGINMRSKLIRSLMERDNVIAAALGDQLFLLYVWHCFDHSFQLPEFPINRSKAVDIPACMLVLQGGANTLNAVASALERDIPVVMIRDDELADDAIMLACDYVDSETKDRVDTEAPKKLQDLSEEHQSAVIDKLKALSPKSSSLSGWIASIDTCIGKRGLITFYSTTETTDLEVTIFKALLNTSDDIMVQMRWAIAWNRFDIVHQRIPMLAVVREQELRRVEPEQQQASEGESGNDTDSDDNLRLDGIVLDENYRKKRKEEKENARKIQSELEELFFYAVGLNRNDFVKAMIEHEVVNMKVAINVKSLTELYASLPKNAGVLTKLISDYNRKIFGDTDSTYSDSGASLHDIGFLVDEKLMGIPRRHRYCWNPEKSPYFQALLDDIPKTQPIKAPYDPVLDLFEYAVLLNRFEQSMLFFEYLRDRITGAVYANKLLRELAKHTSSKEQSELLVENAKKFESCAIDILQYCYKRDPVKTKKLLTRQSKPVGNRTVIQLANDAQALDFISHDSVQSLTNDLWMGYISEPPTSRTLFFVVLSCLIPPLLYTMKYDEKKRIPTPTLLNGSEKTPIDQQIVANLPLRKILYFYNAPITVYVHHLVFYCIFLILLSTETLLYYGKGWNQRWLEILLMIWVWVLGSEPYSVLLFCKDRTWQHRLMAQLSKTSNIVQLSAGILFFVGVALTFTANASAASLSAGRILHCLSLLLFFFSIYKFYAINQKLGPQVVTLTRMLVDLVVWTAIVAVLIIAWGIAQYSLLFPHSDEIGWPLIRDVLVMSFWQIFSQYYPSGSSADQLYSEGAARCSANSSLYATSDGLRCADSTGQWVVPILLGVYVVVIVLLMFNILVTTMFTKKFKDLKKESNKYHNYKRLELISELTEASPLAPPLSLLYGLYRSVIIFMRLRRGVRKGTTPPSIYCKSCSVELGEEEDRKLSAWLKFCELEYWKSERAKETKNVPLFVQDLNDQTLSNETFNNEKDRVENRLRYTNGMLSSMLTVLGRTVTVTKQQVHGVQKSKQIMESNKERSSFNTHQECRKRKYPGTNQLRTHVPDNKVEWKSNWPKYSPPRHSDNQVSQRYAIVDQVQDDSPPALDFNQYDVAKRVNRISSGDWYMVEHGYPLNPMGRTGMGGRGALPLWGPNHAVCCAFTRVKSRACKKTVNGKGKRLKRKAILHENTQVYEILAFYDTALKKWALPMSIFGSVQPPPVDQISKSFEALIQASQYDQEEKTLLTNQLRTLINERGSMMRVGYFDSAYNTDNAWIEANCLVLHDSEGCTADLDNLVDFGGVEAEWIDFHDEALFYGGQRIILTQFAAEYDVFFPFKL